MSTAESYTAEDLELVDDRLADEHEDSAALWAEFAEAEGDSPSSDEDRDDGWSDDKSDGRSAAHEAPDGADADDPDASASGESAAGQDQDSEEDWTNASPEDLRAAVVAARQELASRDHKIRSERGRVSAMHRHLEEARQRIAELESRSAPTGADGGKQRGGGGSAPEGDQQGAGELLSSEDWQRAREEYPDLLGPVESAFRTMRDELSQVRKELDPLKQGLSSQEAQRREAFVEEQTTLLTEAHPDWMDLTQKHGNEFSAFVEQAPRHVREAALRNWNQIVDASEAADVFGRFKDHLGQQTNAESERAGGGSAGPRAPSAPEGAGGAGNRPLDGRRQRQRQSAASTRSGSPSPASGIPKDGDPDAIWAAFAEQERRAAG